MTNRRTDAIYFALFFAVCSIGYFVANHSADEEAAATLPEFVLPELAFEVPFEMPYPMVRFKRRVSPVLALSGDVEMVLVEIRSALLDSSKQVEILPEEQLARLVE